MSMQVNYTLKISAIKKYTCIYKFYITIFHVLLKDMTAHAICIMMHMCTKYENMSLSNYVNKMAVYKSANCSQTKCKIYNKKCEIYGGKRKTYRKKV